MEGSPHSADTRARVIAAFARLGRVDLACEEAGVDRTCHYDWLKKHEDYRASYQEALRGPVAQLLQDEAYRRAVHGVDEPRTVAGKEKTVRVYSDRLMEKLLEAHVLAFRRNSEVELKAPTGGSVTLIIKGRPAPEGDST